MKLIDFIKQNIDLTLNSEIVFFGGSFNPWHEGHSMCVKLLDKDKNLIIVPDHNPQKKLTQNLNKQSSIDSIALIAKELHPNTHIYTDFWELQTKNPTSFWIESLKQNTSLNLSLLMGFDSFSSIFTWIEADSLINNLSAIYIASREDDEQIKQVTIDKLMRINPRLRVIMLGHHQYEHLSSSKIRSQSN